MCRVKPWLGASAGGRAGASTCSIPSGFPLGPARADALSGASAARRYRALADAASKLLLADEPTSSLDPKTSVEIMTLMRDLALARGIPAVVNIHNVDLARRFANRMVGLSGGSVVFDGPPEALTDQHLLTIYGGENWLE